MRYCGSRMERCLQLTALLVLLIITILAGGCIQVDEQEDNEGGIFAGDGSPFYDKFGCLPKNCNSIPDEQGRKFCEEVQAGTYVWGKCDDYPDTPCQDLCRYCYEEGPVQYVTFEELVDYDERDYIIRTKPAEAVVKEGLSSLKQHDRYDVPVIKGTNLIVFCPAIEEGEEFFLENLRTELREMKEDLGLNYVEIRVSFMEDPDPQNSGLILTNQFDFGENACGEYTDNQDILYSKPMARLGPESVAKIARVAKEKGFGVILNLGTITDPVVYKANQDRYGNVNAEDIYAFFTEYSEAQKPYLEMAEREGIELVKLAAEEEVGDDPARINELNRAFKEVVIPNARDIYSGYLTYAENVPYIKNIDFWGDLDYIGVEFYEGLTYEKYPTVAELNEGIKRVFNEYIEPAQSKYDKPVFFGELAYQSYDGDNMPCKSGYRCQWSDRSSYEIDYQEQSDEFEATFDFMNEHDYMYGAVLFNAGYGVLGFTQEEHRNGTYLG